jgi:hypothetical protein
MVLNATSILQPSRAKSKPLPHIEAVDVGEIRFWRLALFVSHMGLELVFNLMNTLTLGRMDVRDNAASYIDLRPFGAEQMGVSRQHLTIRLEDGRVYAIDNNSSNGTKLNNTRLDADKPYVVRHGDVLTLGAMRFEVRMLINPLD